MISNAERTAQQAVSVKQYLKRLRQSYAAVTEMSINENVFIDANAVGLHTEGLE